VIRECAARRCPIFRDETPPLAITRASSPRRALAVSIPKNRRRAGGRGARISSCRRAPFPASLDFLPLNPTRDFTILRAAVVAQRAARSGLLRRERGASRRGEMEETAVCKIRMGRQNGERKGEREGGREGKKEREREIAEQQLTVIGGARGQTESSPSSSSFPYTPPPPPPPSPSSSPSSLSSSSSSSSSWPIHTSPTLEPARNRSQGA